MSGPEHASAGSSPASGRLVQTRPLAGAVWLSRTTWILVAAVAAAVLVTAAMLTPSPAGHGTHTQLGLPPCGFLVMTGVPCPGCGLTTAFAHMIRLEVVAAARANPFGIPLFLITAASLLVSLLGLLRSWPVIRTLDRLHFEKVAIALALAGVLVWGVRLAGVLLGGMTPGTG